jgi:hypothetical protein
MIDIVICSLPQMSAGSVPAAPALLKSAVANAGYTAKTLDLNIDFFVEQCGMDTQKFSEYCSVFRSSETPSDEAIIAANEWVEQSIKKISELNPRIVGLSVFSHYQHRASYLLATKIREQLPNVKIVLGGYGLGQNSTSLMNFIPIKKIHTLKPFPEYITEQGLCDYIVIDDPLNKLIDIIEEVVGGTTVKQVEYLEEKILFNTPIPDYDDYNFACYMFESDGFSLPITGSKGCVRACTFCDVPSRFGKFKIRSGKDIAEEMITLSKKYNVHVFEFTDSLVNGSNRSFLEWLTIVADYNDQQSEQDKIHWLGQYICKPQASIPKNLYSIMYRSGVLNLGIGVESGSNAVLAAMKKQITVEDVKDELKQFQKHNLHANILMLSGFYNETWERYLETLNFLVSCQPYVIDGTIWTINMSFPLLIYDGVELASAAHELGLTLDPYDSANWTTDADPSNDFPERCRRRIITQMVLDKLGINTTEINMDFFNATLGRLKRHEQSLIEKLNGKL